MEEEIKKYRRLYVIKKMLQILAVLGAVVSVFAFMLHDKDKLQQLTAEELAYIEMNKQIETKMNNIFDIDVVNSYMKKEGLHLSLLGKSIIFHMMDLKDGMAYNDMLKEKYYKNPETFNKAKYAPFKPKTHMKCESNITFDQTGKFVNFESTRIDEDSFCNYYKKAIIKIAKKAKLEMPENLTTNYVYEHGIQLARPYEMSLNK